MCPDEEPSSATRLSGRRHSAAPLVVKLGGSLLEAGRARGWLAALAVTGRPVVVVPGGGPFADTVRHQQAPLGYDDGAAHTMAILAMAQTACVFQAWCPAWQQGADPASLQALLAAGRPALWAPTAAPSDLPAGWHITSDSLAAWLATRLGAAGLLLVKSRAAGGTDPVAWAAEGLVDPAFPALAAAYAASGGVVRLLPHDTAPAWPA